ncbi:hypothetical protein [Psychromonas sp.]|uniref:hypothetical protein n=1 Tax=Psychromonas sp. TaxID=1884585 RepID=UPI003563FFFB
MKLIQVCTSLKFVAVQRWPGVDHMRLLLVKAMTLWIVLSGFHCPKINFCTGLEREEKPIELRFYVCNSIG